MCLLISEPLCSELEHCRHLCRQRTYNLVKDLRSLDCNPLELFGRIFSLFLTKLLEERAVSFFKVYDRGTMFLRNVSVEPANCTTQQAIGPQCEIRAVGKI